MSDELTKILTIVASAIVGSYLTYFFAVSRHKKESYYLKKVEAYNQISELLMKLRKETFGQSIDSLTKIMIQLLFLPYKYYLYIPNHVFHFTVDLLTRLLGRYNEVYKHDKSILTYSEFLDLSGDSFPEGSIKMNENVSKEKSELSYLTDPMRQIGYALHVIMKNDINGSYFTRLIWFFRLKIPCLRKRIFIKIFK